MSGSQSVRGRRGAQESPISTSGSNLSPPESFFFFFNSLRIFLFPGSFLQSKTLESLKELTVELGERAKEIHTQGIIILQTGL